MSLYDDGLFELDAPSSQYLPEYSKMRVVIGLDADGAPILEAARNPIKVIDIFRHTACFGYGWERTPAASDTSYFVPMDEKARVAAGYLKNDTSGLPANPIKTSMDFGLPSRCKSTEVMVLSAPLTITCAFARMLQNEGSLNNLQIIKPETLALMFCNHLPDTLTDRDFLPSKGTMMGLGLGVAIRTGPPEDATEPFGVTGEFFWDGAASILS